MTATSRRLLLAIAIFALLGIAVSSVSLDHHFRKSKTSYCDFGQAFNCDIVNRSEYSTVAGVPVALVEKYVLGVWCILCLTSLFAIFMIAVLSCILFLHSVCRVRRV
jgi:hypothetical protein